MYWLRGNGEADLRYSTNNGALAPPASPSASSSIEATPEQQLQQGEPSELPACTEFRLPSDPFSYLSRGTRAPQTSVSLVNSSSATLKHNYPKPLRAPPLPELWPQQSIRAAFLLCWNLLTCQIMIRAGPMTIPRSYCDQERYYSKPYEQI